MIIPKFKKGVTVKRLKQLERNHDSREYQEWRNYVLKRDGHCCQYPKCFAETELQVHHIRRWADAPHLRTDPSNGITLCATHHKLVTGSERFFELAFMQRAKFNEAQYSGDD